MPLTERVYRAAAAAAWLLAPAAARGGSKAARGVRARRGAAAGLIEWARSERDPARPLLWMHAPSVGEGLQARAVLDVLRAARPDLQIVFTYFSPSAEALAARMPADRSGPLPWDTDAEAGRAVRALCPSALVFTKSDVWPVLSAVARATGARTALIAAAMRPGSSRLRWPARALLRPTLSALDLCAVSAAEDVERLTAAGVPTAALHVSGDPGVDSAAARAAGADPAARHLRPFCVPRRPTLVAGSTWPSDENVLLPAWAAVRASHPDVRLVIAPHEPTSDAVRMLESRLAAAGWRTSRLAEVEASGAAGDADAVVVDRVGVLAQLYTVADVAWVGGGFHGAGVHSVLEPAAAGVPMLFGPRHRNASAAAPLLLVGAARAVLDAGDAAPALAAWLDEPAARMSAGRSGQSYIGTHLGASQRTAEHVSRLIPVTSAR
ncbi:MAG: hypothetical protein EXR95_05765 [Gemmatimonadetes bacterium]|nr:hypothetical protein [Gemmatimonadota bacterium]